MCEIKTKNKEFLKHVGLNPEIYIIKTNLFLHSGQNCGKKKRKN